jgi:hypothetical protein
MMVVFAKSFEQAKQQGNLEMSVLILREFRDLPLSLVREHWYALTDKEYLMIPIHKKPKWSFYLSWVMLSALSVPLAFVIYWRVISIIVPWIGGRMQVGALSVITEDYLLPYIFIPAIGLLTGFFQYFLLRRYWSRIGWWILATSLGWVLLGAVDVLRYPLFLRFGPDFTYIWLPVITCIICGGIAGLAQWLLLRRRLPHATWWIAASILGWGLIGLTANETLKDFGILAWLFAPIATGATLWLLVKKLPSPDGEGVRD